MCNVLWDECGPGQASTSAGCAHQLRADPALPCSLPPLLGLPQFTTWPCSLNSPSTPSARLCLQGVAYKDAEKMLWSRNKALIISQNPKKANLIPEKVESHKIEIKQVGLARPLHGGPELPNPLLEWLQLAACVVYIVYYTYTLYTTQHSLNISFKLKSTLNTA